jgi:2'-5' RNA ligase
MQSTSDSSYRLFVGIRIPSPIGHELAVWKESAKRELPFQKWTHPEDVHITLQFLGVATPEIAEALSPDLRRLAAETPPLRLRVDGLGVFGAPTAPTILWAGIAGDLEALHALQSQVERICASHGFTAETRAYRPHLTLARRARGAFSRAALTQAALPAAGTAEWAVQDIVLYRSHIGRKPAYEPLGVFPLGGNA